MTIHNATHLEVEAEVRYWEDATVNGVEDAEGTLIFGRDRDGDPDLWKVSIDLAEGRIVGWPEGMVAETYYKVCDAGHYWLTDATGQRIAKWKGYYVPDDYLCHPGSGFGDYIILNISADGVIESYTRPEIDFDRWEPLPREGEQETASVPITQELR